MYVIDDDAGYDVGANRSPWWLRRGMIASNRTALSVIQVITSINY